MMWKISTALTAACVVLGCGTSAKDPPAAFDLDASTDLGALSACPSEGECRHDLLPADHVANLKGVVHNSNPPSSGNHCGSWGQYAVFGPPRPLPRCNYIHNLEHGAVVLLYNCPGGCPDVVSDLRALIAAATDPDGCAKKRFILTPDADLDTKVAAAAWGFTWRSATLDAAARTSLATFMAAHIGSRGLSEEARVCSDGSVEP